jgi:hypothetical protein
MALFMKYFMLLKYPDRRMIARPAAGHRERRNLLILETMHGNWKILEMGTAGV